MNARSDVVSDVERWSISSIPLTV